MKLSVLGIWRDSESYIYDTLQSLENLQEKYDVDYYFYENDSQDNTKHILADWLSKKKGKLVSESLDKRKYGSVIDIERFKLLANYRNKIKQILLDNTQSSITLLLDTDISFNNQDISYLVNALSEDVAMSVANTRQDIPDLMLQESDDSFYDVLPIRDTYNNSGLYFTDCPLLLNSDRKLWKNNENVIVNAAFSGVSIIKTRVLSHSFWSTTGYSEHINFCTDVRKSGDITIVPNSKPRVKLDISSLPIANFQNAANQQKQIYQYLNQAHVESLDIL